MKQAYRLVALLLLLLVLPPLQAQQSQDFGEYVVHFNALNSTLIPPDVAKQYGIQRSDSRALLSITVLKKVLDTPGTPVHAQITASATNLTGQRRELTLREIEDRPSGEEDSGAVYYVGQFTARNMETYNFVVEVVPDGEEEPLVVRFRQQFYTE